MTGRKDLFTIGHSNHSIERFVELLRSAAVAAIADVRTTPFSRWVPHFSQTALERHLESAGIAYLFSARSWADDRATRRAGATAGLTMNWLRLPTLSGVA